MFKFIVFSFTVLLVAQNAAAAKVRAGKQAAPAAQATAEEPTALEKFAADVQVGVKNVTEVLKGNLPDSKDVVNKLTENVQTLADNVQATAKKIKEGIKDHQGDVDSVLKQVSETLTKTNANLLAAIGPDGQKRVEEIKTKFEEGLKQAANQAEKLSKAIEPTATDIKNEIKDVTHNFLEQLAKLTQQVADMNKPAAAQKPTA